MHSPRLKEASRVCLHSCCPAPLFKMTEPQKTVSKSGSTSSVCRRDFALSTAASIFPNTRFTNHESLPSLRDSFVEFTKAYPQFSETHQVDDIRAQEYYHLSQSNHACLDYIGIGLFSFEQLQKQKEQRASTSSCSSPALFPSPSRSLNFPFFGISYKTGNLKVQLLHGGQESELESAMKRRIMGFLNISEGDYSMVFTANRTSAFKLVADSYPFKTSRNLLTVYDYQSEAVESMVHSSEKRGAHSMSAEFSWPRLRINSSKLRNMVVSKKKKKKKRGLFVFPLHSRVTGARYPYLWMNIAQENGWHVLIDACALGPKDMDCFGLSLLRPDFLICSFYKVFGENPSGFGCLFVKKAVISILEDSTSTGIVNIVPAKELLQVAEDSSGTDLELEQKAKFALEEAGLSSSSSFSGPLSNQTRQSPKLEQGESSDFQNVEITARLEGPESSETGKSEVHIEHAKRSRNEDLEFECRGLDHVDSLGLIMTTNRSRYLINWLVSSLMKLEHPNAEGVRLVKIYGPKIKFDRGPALAFNVFDWKGEKVEPVLVQKLADRSSISLSYGFLHHIYFSDKYAEEKGRVLEKTERASNRMAANNLKGKCDQGITVITAALGFLANFEDTYRLWAFVAQFLDADFVEKERWRYTALNQKTVEV
ncbi:Glycine dehydrogenase (decarboxylating) [Trema orientale]|uniref:Glycine dehydrogenase (Decarboxylating) n=1 Tax=Trema orientale TaxID=63057 RepID=A0A2P5ERA7_TREOI|nr:Glycine dehydrogenase (decarboxylating) [Trema orientale]